MIQAITVTSPVISAGSNRTICSGSSTTLNGSGGTSYTWTPSTGLSCTSCASPVATPSINTDYTVTATTLNGCSNTASVTIYVSAIPIANAGNDVSLCDGSTTTLNASGGSSYNWTPSTGLSCTNCPSPVASPTSNITYTVTATNATGCTDSDAMNVNISALPNADAGNDLSLCSGSTVTINASGGSSYNWSPSTGLSCTNCPSPVANPTSDITYTVTATNAAGCTDTDAMMINVSVSPVVNAGSDVSLCIGSTSTLSAAGGNSYTWSPSTGLSCTNCPNPIASPSSDIIYTVTASNSAGCTDTDAITVNVYSLPAANAGADVSICNGSNTILSASGGSSYSWSPSIGLSCTNCPDPVANPSSDITYTVTVINAAGCSDTDEININISSLPVANAGPDVSICTGSTTTLNASGGNSYSWTPSMGLSCMNCPYPVCNATITTEYVVTVTDANSCSSTAAVNVLVNPLPMINLNADTTLCEEDELQLNASGATSFTWIPATGLSCNNCPDPIFTATSSASYQVTGVDYNGCTNIGTTIINVNPLPQIDAGIDLTVCEGQTIALMATGGLTYTWSPSAGLSCNQCPDPIFSGVSSTTYTLVGSDANGCQNSDDMYVTVSICTIIDEMDLSKSIFLYPNPSNNFFTINSTEEVIKVQIYRLNGELIYSSIENNKMLKISTVDFSSEVYLIRLITNETTITKKLVIEK
jgi:hypothetical protein